MSNKLPSTLLSIGKTIYTWSTRITKFVRHRMLTKRKNILIIGRQSTPLYVSLHPKLVKTWEITNLIDDKSASSTLSSNQQTIKDQASLQTAKSDNKSSVQVSNTKEKVHYTKLYLYDNNYKQIQKKLQGRQFDSIIVLPQQDSAQNCFNIQDQDFVTEYPVIHSQLLMRNLFAYRLANKYLTSSGVIILSASERDFIKQSQSSVKNNEQQLQNRQWWDSNEIIDAQISYLGVVIGDRDYTDLNSWIVVALSKQVAEENPQLVAEHYRQWADSQNLPMPGSFALFRASPSNYVEYL